MQSSMFDDMSDDILRGKVKSIAIRKGCGESEAISIVDRLTEQAYQMHRTNPDSITTDVIERQIRIIIFFEIEFARAITSYLAAHQSYINKG